MKSLFLAIGMNYDRRSVDWAKTGRETSGPDGKEMHLVKWVWALIAIAFVLSLIR